MAVYVDDMFRYPMGQFKRGNRTYKMSHMMADTDEELHKMARKIGVGRVHHQDKGRWCDSHYDICMSKRELAIELGAVPISLREMSAYNWHRRKFGFAVVPKIAAEKMRAAFRAGREASHA